jgi:uncharacterized protein (DUF4213/DUF364 family)
VSIIDALLDGLDYGAAVRDVRIGTHWTAVALETAQEPRGGLASSFGALHDHHTGQPAVRDAGRLHRRSASDLAKLVHSKSAAEASVGLATINALLRVDTEHCVEVNAADVLLERGKGKRVAIVGHFPFLPRLERAAKELWVLELAPRGNDLPASAAVEVIPQADVVGITGSTLVNHTFDELIPMCRPDAYVVVLGGSTPLSPRFFDYGVDAVAGTLVVDVEAVLSAVAQGATFPQIAGKRLLTWMKEK